MLSLFGIWVQQSQTLTATNLEAILLCTPNHWEDCSLNLCTSQMSDKQPSLSILCQCVVFWHNESRMQSLYGAMSLIRNNIKKWNGHYSGRTCIWQPLGKNYQILTHRYGYQALQLMCFRKLDDFQTNVVLLFYQLLYIHTCELEFDIFLLRWDMINQHFLPMQILCKYYSIHFFWRHCR